MNGMEIHGTGEILMKRKIQTTLKSLTIIGKLLGNSKDKIKLETQGLYSISCTSYH